MITIGQLSQKTGLAPDTLRYYEKEGLLVPDDWSPNGYRLYEAGTLRRIRFIRQAQECGFSLSEIREFLVLQKQGTSPSGEVKKQVLEKKRELEQRIRTMQSMVRTLDRLGSFCCDETRPVKDCPILTAFQEEVLSRENADKGNPARRSRRLQEGLRRSQLLKKEDSP